VTRGGGYLIEVEPGSLDLDRFTRLVEEGRRARWRHSYRERPRGQLMLALYREGRQAEALEAYRDARTALVEGLGIEPGPRLRELHAAILAQDPRWTAPPPPHRPDAMGRPRPRCGACGRRLRDWRSSCSRPC
jgi:hypothetical protein